MAIVFMLVVECGNDRVCAEAIVERFRTVRWTLSDGSTIGCEQDPNAVWRWQEATWCRLIPEGVSANGVNQRIQSASLRIEVTKRLYAELKSLQGYRFALVGWEAASDLEWQNIAGANLDLQSLPLGLVINQDLFESLGRQRDFEAFGVGTWWRPLTEEGYQQLVALFPA